MRLLILSEYIDHQQRFGEVKYLPPDDVHLETGNLNNPECSPPNILDHDVTVVHINEPRHNSIGYYNNLPVLIRDAGIALQNGRSLICLPQSGNFRSKTHGHMGVHAYEWVALLGITLQDSVGTDIKPSAAGRARVVETYLRCASRYFQIAVHPPFQPAERLAVVDDTEIVVGLERSIGRGTLAILPPAVLGPCAYTLAMSALVDLAYRYHERAVRSVLLEDTPDWVPDYLVPRVRELDEHIRSLAHERSQHDELAYVLYGTGERLEKSVGLLLQKLGLLVEFQPKGSNVDLVAKDPLQGVILAVEVTGTKQIVHKDSPKIAQAWQHLQVRSGTPEEQHRLVIVANTEYHLRPTQRRADAFTRDAAQLLGSNGVLLVTTVQLYDLWRSVYEGSRTAGEAVVDLFSQSGLYQL